MALTDLRVLFDEPTVITQQIKDIISGNITVGLADSALKDGLGNDISAQFAEIKLPLGENIRKRDKDTDLSVGPNGSATVSFALSKQVVKGDILQVEFGQSQFNNNDAHPAYNTINRANN